MVVSAGSPQADAISSLAAAVSLASKLKKAQMSALWPVPRLAVVIYVLPRWEPAMPRMDPLVHRMAPRTQDDSSSCHNQP